MSLRNILNNQSLVFTVGGSLPTILNLIFLPVYSNFLSPEEFGSFSYIMSFQTILIVVLSLCLNNFLLRNFFDTDSEREIKINFGTIFIFLTIFNAVAVSLLFQIMPNILFDEKSQDLSMYFRLMLTGLFFEYFFLFPQIIFRVYRQAKFYVLFNITRQILTFIISIYLIGALDYGIEGRFISIILINIVFAIVSFYLISSKSIFRFDSSVLKKGIIYSLPILPASIIGSVYVSLDKIILLEYISLEMLGIYTLAASIGSAINFISLGFYRAVEPNIFEDYASKKLLPTIENSYLFLLAIMSLFGLMISLFAKELLEIFFHPDFIKSSNYVCFFVVAYIFNGQRRIFNTVLHAFKVTKYDLPLTVIGLIMFLCSFFILVPMIGVYGALASIMIGSISSFICTNLLVSRFIKVKAYSIILVFFCLLILGLSIFFNSDIIQSQFAIFTLKMLISLVCLSFLIIYLRRNPEIIPK